MPAQLEEPLAHVITIEREQDLEYVLAGLRPEQLELLQLRYAGELSYRQIGEVVGKSEAAVKMAIHRLLDQLQREMEHEHE
jgi:RNA polymerase sigma-70 factor (ECF subfamily)